MDNVQYNPPPPPKKNPKKRHQYNINNVIPRKLDFNNV